MVGWLVDRHDVKWIYAAGFFVWSLAMASTGLANSFAGLLAARLCLGIGESVFLPSVSKIVVRLFPPERRGLPNALVDVGTKVGPALSIYLGGRLLQDYGWRTLFIGVGLGSLLWLIPALPFASALILILFGSRLSHRAAAAVGVVSRRSRLRKSHTSSTVTFPLRGCNRGIRSTDCHLGRAVSHSATCFDCWQRRATQAR